VRGLPRVLSVPAVLTGRRLVLAIAAVVAAVAAAGGTAIALTTSAPSHAVSMSRGDLTRAALKERYYSAVMAATGLLYLAILTAFGTDLVARAVLAP